MYRCIGACGVVDAVPSIAVAMVLDIHIAVNVTDSEVEDHRTVATIGAGTSHKIGGAIVVGIIGDAVNPLQAVAGREDVGTHINVADSEVKGDGAVAALCIGVDAV